MSEYTLSQIKKDDKRSNRLMDELLSREGIMRDGNLDYSLGLFDEDYNLVATGSCFKNTLRCMAVDSSHQGEGLLNQIVTALMDYQSSLGNHDLFLYTKCSSAKFFEDLGFYELARVRGKLIFMENSKTAFANYLEKLSAYKKSGSCGGIVVNANPFTLGHRYLIETAARALDQLFVFVVSEDASLVPFDLRMRLVREGLKDLDNITVLESGSYIISSATFPSYFLKDNELVIDTHARLDAVIFTKIAEAMNISKRFVGEEPTSLVTGIYNRVLQEELGAKEIEVKIIPRLSIDGTAISASTVRRHIKSGNLQAIKPLVPASTYDYFCSDEAKDLIERIKAADEKLVGHY